MFDNATQEASWFLRLDPVCDRFERAWREGARPGLEDYLGSAQEPERSWLLRELRGAAAEAVETAREADEPIETVVPQASAETEEPASEPDEPTAEVTEDAPTAEVAEDAPTVNRRQKTRNVQRAAFCSASSSVSAHMNPLTIAMFGFAG